MNTNEKSMCVIEFKTYIIWRKIVKHEIFNKNVKIVDTDITFEHIYSQNYIPKEYMEDIKKANLLIIPDEGLWDTKDVFFPETTREFFEFIRDYSDKDVIADIAISDEDFQRVELHSAVIEVATIIVESAIFDIAIGIISSFLYDLVKKYRRNTDETSAKVKIITKETKRKKSKMIIYEGPVSGIKDALDQASKEIFSESKNYDN